MSQSTSGPCLVCGEETTSRCEACRQAGIDLFFCSREHQKLLWPAHKKVCGPGKANPFRWLDLGQDEADEARSNLSVRSGGWTGPAAGPRYIHLSHNNSRRWVSSDPSKSLAGDEPLEQSFAFKQQALLTVRAKERTRPFATGSSSVNSVEESIRLASLFVFDSVGRDPPPALSYSIYCHRVLTITGLRCACVLAATAEERARALPHVSGANVRLLASVATELHEAATEASFHIFGTSPRHFPPLLEDDLPPSSF